MKSDLPKGLHAVCGLPMVECVGRAMVGAGIAKPVVVVGHGSDLIMNALGDEKYSYCLQTEQLGTGHAALMAKDLLAFWSGPVVVAPGDAPLITSEVFQALAQHHQESKAAVTIATCTLANPRAYGRILRDSNQKAMAIIEEKDASAEQRKIQEVCVSVYCFDAEFLFKTLPSLSSNNAQREYYLTDTVSAAYAAGQVVETVNFEDSDVLLGVNDRWQLAEVSAMMNRRIAKRHCLNGVTIFDPATTWIGADVEIEPECTIEAMTILEGKCSIGAGSVIGPMSRICNSEIGEECLVHMSRLDRAKIGDGVRVGPFANLRPKTVVQKRAKIGNFVEIKNSHLGERVSVSHLSYVGDAVAGADTNIGAGTITCNYDGFEKHQTTIGERAFIGSNSTLVAPVTIGDGSVVAAGSVIVGDVPADSLALGRARQEVKEEWAIQWRERKKSTKV